MESLRSATWRVVAGAVLLLTAGAGGGCADREGEPAADVPNDTASAAPVDSMRELAASIPAPRAGSSVFAHDPHRDVRCDVCHTAIPGHAAHGELVCRDCHEAPQTLRSVSFGPGECLSCHHAPERKDCGQCHASAGPAPLARPVTFHLPTDSAIRELTFDHARHRQFECTTCHVAPVSYAVTRGCGECHDRHHQVDRDCTACHPSQPLNIHTARAHLGCGGSGCHDDPVVLALPQSRAVCLTCHRDKTAHEPGRECAPCHFPSQRRGS